MWHHPKYYKELRKRNKEEARAQLKVPSSDLDQVISDEAATAATSVHPGPGLKLQAREDIIHEENERLYDRSNKSTSPQADEPKVQARKLRVQASSQSSEEPVSQNRGTSEPSPCQGYKQQG